MKSSISPVIRPEELLVMMNSDDLLIVDASGGPQAKENYQARHLKGAIFADINKDLADIKSDAANGGRHPLPNLEQFGITLGKLGIAPSTHVIAYDDMNGGNAAARLWWMLRAIGHDKVQVLSGGIQAAEKAGVPLTPGNEQPKATTAYPVAGWGLPQADMAEVEQVAQDGEHIVIDVRDAKRYAGLTEPIDLIAGHIPGAINVPFSSNLSSDGHFKPADELREKYKAVFGNTPASNIIVHCGSGVTACHTLLAADYAGFEIPKLYVGSWSEWSRNDKEMVTAADTGS